MLRHGKSCSLRLKPRFPSLPQHRNISMKSPCTLILMTWMSLFTVSTVLADLSLTFSSDNGATFSNQFEVANGDNLTVQVFLSDDQPGGILETSGLFAFGLQASTSPSNLGLITDAAIDPIFDLDVTDTFTNSSLEWEDAVFGNTIPTGQSISVGTLTYEVTGFGTTTFTFGHNNPGEVKWLDGNGTPIDELVFGSNATGTFTFTVGSSAVPEPNIWLGICLGVALVATRRVRGHSLGSDR